VVLTAAPSVTRTRFGKLAGSSDALALARLAATHLAGDRLRVRAEARAWDEIAVRAGPPRRAPDWEIARQLLAAPRSQPERS
jgi:hypothetical protein